MASDGGLTITRREGQSFVMSARPGQEIKLTAGEITVEVIEIRVGGTVRLKIKAPPEVLILRSELRAEEETRHSE